MTVVVHLFRAVRVAPSDKANGQPFALLALLSLVYLFATGVTVDLRFFVCPNIVVLLLVGAAVGCAEAAKRLSVEGRS